MDRYLYLMTTEHAKENLELLSDEELAALCTKGIEAAERELMGRHMQAIYWLPHRILGVPEEELSGFLIFALEKMRERDTLSKFNPTRGARFTTWLGVVIRRLYIDYLRSMPDEPSAMELQEQQFEAPIDRRKNHSSLLEHMQHRCKVMFKILLCDTFSLTPEEIEWIAKESGRGIIETSREIAELEERLREYETRIEERYDKLARSYYWKSFYSRQIAELEKKTELPNIESGNRLERLRSKLERRQREYDSISYELAGIGGIVTAPYKEMAHLLNVREGTLASNISRCRSGAVDLLRNLRDGKNVRTGNK